ncbi:hypothetical protein [Chryseobacterium sp. CT-SW4]|uniref:hypothetical protein n=1 Tax=Chryseobacterium sp. SW-1 TaxID=3157343 RepID=UPI003B01F958
MSKIRILIIILIFGIFATIITLLSFRIELIQDSTVKILLSLCTILGILIGRLLDNFYNQEEKHEISKEIDEIGKD